MCHMQILLDIDDFKFLEENATKDTLNLIKSKIFKRNSVLITISNYSDFMVELNFDIVENGMDDEDTVNEVGKKLYNIYDKILDQKARNQNEN